MAGSYLFEVTVQLHYTVDGPEDGPVLVLGSPLGTTGAVWQPQVAVLSERFRVVRYDHRGHGASPVPQGPYALADLGQDVLALLDRLDAPRVHLGGISLGGIVAIWVAAHAPERIDRLMLMCTAARLSPPEMWTERAAAVRSDGMSAITETVLGRWFTPEFAKEHPAVVGWVRRMLATSPAEGYAACCEALGTMDLTPVLSQISAPTLVIAADQDPSTPLPLVEHIASKVPNARLEVVPDAAHLVIVEQPAKVNRLLLDFLA
ncbi:MAG TPA: 3-oxoadipate enol-lactonase [Micromonosporaceae bacterium]|nr:3-oxoadipate enol-lactonase [Micromonosporaceae bacterium]